eukprot:TRINITY_DN25076_c0_g1_i1.p1 TRINITY_DN25076_c0_g1~~TRINITY_DN25076_c0_g1_i1.p1  ORF type:complete len:480 (+),score=102.98 TRINITY_DN25076_c0_g1_i1:137-1576(+)
MAAAAAGAAGGYRCEAAAAAAGDGAAGGYRGCAAAAGGARVHQNGQWVHGDAAEAAAGPAAGHRGHRREGAAAAAGHRASRGSPGLAADAAAGADMGRLGAGAAAAAGAEIPHGQVVLQDDDDTEAQPRMNLRSVWGETEEDERSRPQWCSAARRAEDKSLVDFKGLEQIGAGMYGVVYRARHTADGRNVVIKKFKLEECDEGMHACTVREISVLEVLNHPNIVKLLWHVWASLKVYLVFEFCDHTLAEITAAEAPPWTVLPLAQQMLQGTAYCHSRAIIHRDMKPQNVLVSAQGELRICDFGLARLFNYPPEPLTREVITLWYRAPEIMLGLVTYTPAVDLWSVGCIIGEMINRVALFRGDCEVGTYVKICELLGSPQPQGPWALLTHCPDWQDGFPNFKGYDIGRWIHTRDADLLDLVRELLNMDFQQRLSAKLALLHPAFRNLPVRHFTPMRDCARPERLQQQNRANGEQAAPLHG